MAYEHIIPGGITAKQAAELPIGRPAFTSEMSKGWPLFYLAEDPKTTYGLMEQDGQLVRAPIKRLDDASSR